MILVSGLLPCIFSVAAFYIMMSYSELIQLGILIVGIISLVVLCGMTNDVSYLMTSLQVAGLN